MAHIHKLSSSLETLKRLAHRYEILFGAKVKDKSKILRASKRIDRIRKNFGQPPKGFSSVNIIRKYREQK